MVRILASLLIKNLTVFWGGLWSPFSSAFPESIPITSYKMIIISLEKLGRKRELCLDEEDNKRTLRQVLCTSWMPSCYIPQLSL